MEIYILYAFLYILGNKQPEKLRATPALAKSTQQAGSSKQPDVKSYSEKTAQNVKNTEGRNSPNNAANKTAAQNKANKPTAPTTTQASTPTRYQIMDRNNTNTSCNGILG